MVATELRVWREIDNRVKDEAFVQMQDEEIRALRREVRRLRARVRDLEAR